MQKSRNDIKVRVCFYLHIRVRLRRFLYSHDVSEKNNVVLASRDCDCVRRKPNFPGGPAGTLKRGMPCLRAKVAGGVTSSCLYDIFECQARRVKRP